MTRDFVVSTVAIAGDIEGVVGGPAASAIDLSTFIHLRSTPAALVWLESLDGPTDMVQITDSLLMRLVVGRSRFAFKDIPAGRYRLSLVPLDGRVYEPPFLDVSPPYDEAIFTTNEIVSGDDCLTLKFLVRDRGSGEPISEFSALLRIGPFWTPHVRTGGPDGLNVPIYAFRDNPMSFVVSAPGYVPVRTDLTDAQIEANTGVLRTDLEPGWGVALVVYDTERNVGQVESLSQMIPANVFPVPAHGLAGARVFAGEHRVRTSDPTGLALITTDGPIDAKDISVDGSIVLAVERFRSHAETPDGIGFVFAARE